jgi:hypothetical protein
MLEKQGTCQHCGYEKRNCMCGRKRNTSGDYVAYNNYTDYRNINDYAMTARINRTSAEDRKIMEELLPIDGEPLDNYIERTNIAEQKLTEHAIQHHLYGTKRVWSCHTSSRYCFICTMAQYINTTRSILMMMKDLEKTKYIINVDNSQEPPLLSISPLAEG